MLAMSRWFELPNHSRPQDKSSCVEILADSYEYALFRATAAVSSWFQPGPEVIEDVTGLDNVGGPRD